MDRLHLENVPSLKEGDGSVPWNHSLRMRNGQPKLYVYHGVSARLACSWMVSNQEGCGKNVRTLWLPQELVITKNMMILCEGENHIGGSESHVGVQGSGIQPSEDMWPILGDGISPPHLKVLHLRTVCSFLTD